MAKSLVIRLAGTGFATGLGGAVAKSLVIRLAGAGFASRY